MHASSGSGLVWEKFLSLLSSLGCVLRPQNPGLVRLGLCMDIASLRSQLTVVLARLAEQEHQNHWYSFHIQQAQQSVLARQIHTIRRSLLRVLVVVRQQRLYIHRLSHRVGVLEERLEVAHAQTADQADVFQDLDRAVASLRTVLAQPLLELDGSSLLTVLVSQTRAGVGLELSFLGRMVRWPDSLESRSAPGS